MGKKPGYQQVTFYVDPDLYARVRLAANSLDENMYEFVGEALTSAFDRRVNKTQRETIEAMVKQIAKGRRR